MTGKTMLQIEPGESVSAPSAQGTSAARGSIVLLASFFISAVLNYAFAILMSYLLSVERYGILGVMQTILSLAATIMTAGFPWALTRLLSRRPAREAGARAFRAALLGNTVLGCVLGASLYGATLRGWLPLGHEYLPLMALAAVMIVVTAVGSVFNAALQGSLRFIAFGVVRSLEVIAKAVMGTALVLLGASTFGAVAGFLLGAVLATIMAVALLRDFHFWRGHGWREREVYASAGPFFLGVLSLAVLVNADVIGLKVFSPPALSNQLAGHYQAAVVLARIPVFLVLALLSAVFPHVARHPARSDIANAYATLALKYTLLFIVPIDVVFVVQPHAAIRFFFSAVYDVSAGPLALVALGTILLTLIHAFAMLLQAAGRLWMTAVVLAGTVVVELVALALLVGRLQIVGAPLALIVAGLLSLVFLLPAARRTYQLALSGRAAGAYGLALATFVAALWLLPHGGRLATLSAIVGAGALYLVALALLGLLTRRDVEMLAEGFGPRPGAMLRRCVQAIEALRMTRDAR